MTTLDPAIAALIAQRDKDEVIARADATVRACQVAFDQGGEKVDQAREAISQYIAYLVTGE